MKKIITSITAILLIGTSVTNFGSASLNNITLSDITKVYAKDTDDKSDMIKCGDDAYYTLSDNGTTITISGKGDINYIPDAGKNIKSIIIKNGITRIFSDSFSYCENLENISLPDSISYIHNGIFENSLWYKNQPDGIVYAGKVAYKYKGEMEENTDLTFKEGTTAIAEKAFYECSGIRSVTFPDGIKTIPYLSFMNCYNITSVTIPESVTDIGAYAFYNCYSLKKVIIPDNVTDVGPSAFGNCYMLEDIAFPDSITFMGQYAFNETLWYYNQPQGIIYAGKTVCGYKGNDTTADIVIKEGTKTIATSAFDNCTQIKSVKIPDSVTSTGCCVFEGCTNLENVTFSDSMTELNTFMFNKCNSLKSVTIPENISCIGDSAFSQAPSLESVTFLSEKLDIGYNAFGSVPNLKDVYYVGSEEDWKQKVSIDLDNEQLKKATIHFNDSPLTGSINSVQSEKINCNTQSITYGDINSDGIIDITDLIQLSLFLLRDIDPDEKSMTAADVSGDGIVNIVDLAVLKQYICNDVIKLGPKA